MGVQRPDDAVRRLRKVWLGPAGSWRWPFDARYEAWAMWFAATPVLAVALALAVPTAVVVAVVAVTAARAYAPTPSTRRWYATTVVAVAAIIDNPLGWWMPLPTLAAVVAAPAVSVIATRALMRHVTYERPVRFWTSLLRQYADAPRPTRGPVGYRPIPLLRPPAVTTEPSRDAHTITYGAPPE